MSELEKTVSFRRTERLLQREWRIFSYSRNELVAQGWSASFGGSS